MSTPTKRFMNWTGVAFTPTLGTAIPFTGVESVKFDAGGSLAKFAGDGNRYNSTIVNDFNEPIATVSAADVGAAGSIGVGTVGTLTATLNDAKNGAGTGAITFTFLCICSKNGFSGKHRAYAMADIEFEGYSADGETNPLSSSVAA